MHGGGNRIYGLHVIIHNRLFAECEVLDNFRGLIGLVNWSRGVADSNTACWCLYLRIAITVCARSLSKEFVRSLPRRTDRHRLYADDDFSTKFLVSTTTTKTMTDRCSLRSVLVPRHRRSYCHYSAWSRCPPPTAPPFLLASRRPSLRELWESVVACEIGRCWRRKTGAKSVLGSSSRWQRLPEKLDELSSLAPKRRRRNLKWFPGVYAHSERSTVVGVIGADRLAAAAQTARRSCLLSPGPQIANSAYNNSCSNCNRIRQRHLWLLFCSYIQLIFHQRRFYLCYATIYWVNRHLRWGLT